MDVQVYLGADIFDGTSLHQGMALAVRPPNIAGLVATADIPARAERIDLGGGLIAPGFVDLQVNGGDGVMFNDAPAVETLETIAAAHARLGATAILPTLITDTAEKTAAAIGAVETAISKGVPGIAGLHLEGPHLSVARKGAHEERLIRPATDHDIHALIEAKGRLPVLMVTVAPESVTGEQISALADAGVIVSLGHTNATFGECVEAMRAGALCTTHLFNAMSQLGSRDPGLVGATLETGSVSAGLIADMVHVAAPAIGAAMRAKRRPGRIFLVSDAMATVGSDIDEFTLNGRRIMRSADRLTLADGTLAGAHLDIATAIRNMVDAVGIDLAEALSMATSAPAAVIGQANAIGYLANGRRADFVHLGEDLSLKEVWINGRALP